MESIEKINEQSIKKEILSTEDLKSLKSIETLDDKENKINELKNKLNEELKIESKKDNGVFFNLKKNVKRGTLAAFFGLSSFLPAKANNENDKKDISKKNVSGISIYTKSNTKEGAITPTGRNNSFYENPYGITELTIKNLSKKYGFRYDSNVHLQEDLISYLEKNNPEIIKQTLENFGQTAAGKLNDNILGARTAFMIKELSKIPLVEDKPIIENTLSKIENQPEGGYVINVRGDAKNNVGAYYFIKDKSIFEKIINNLPKTPNSESEKGDGTGQATYDMNHNVFLGEYGGSSNYEKISPEILNLLGPAYIRDSENAKLFKKKNNTNYYHVPNTGIDDIVIK